MNYNEALKYIHSLEKLGCQLGLDRIKLLLEQIDNPQDKLKIIHIGGTNGKGSTTTMCANILKNAGYKCASYISPFVLDFRERFQINGKMISREDFTKYTAIIKEKIDVLNNNGVKITEFEAITAIAFLYFYEQNCDIVCLEVGLGGNYDATNVIKNSLVSIITSISLDHVDILGDTIQEIAIEKAGIIKSNGVCICYCNQNVEALAVLMEKCSKMNAKLIKANVSGIDIIKNDITGNTFMYEDKLYKTSLVGIHQIYNAVSVIECMKIINQKGFQVSDECVKQGIQNTVFTARFEVISKSPTIIVDGAHNLESMTALANCIKSVKANKKYAIIGMLKDKDYEQSLKQILNSVDEIICVCVKNDRGVDPKILAHTVCDTNKTSYSYSCKDSIEKILDKLDKDDLLLVCGSLYMVGDAREIIINYIK